MRRRSEAREAWTNDSSAGENSFLSASGRASEKASEHCECERTRRDEQKYSEQDIYGDYYRKAKRSSQRFPPSRFIWRENLLSQHSLSSRASTTSMSTAWCCRDCNLSLQYFQRVLTLTFPSPHKWKVSSALLAHSHSFSFILRPPPILVSAVRLYGRTAASAFRRGNSPACSTLPFGWPVSARKGGLRLLIQCKIN